MSKELVTIGNKNSLLTLGPDLGMHSHNKEIMRQKVCQGGHWCGNNPSDKMIKPRFQNILKSSEKQVKVLTVGHSLCFQTSEENGHGNGVCSPGLRSSHSGGGECCGTYEQQS